MTDANAQQHPGAQLDSAKLFEAHATYIGTTEGGKTFMEKVLMTRAECPEYVVFIDGKGNTDLPGFHVLHEPASFDPKLLLEHPRIRIVPPRGRVGIKRRRALVDDVCTSLLRLGSWLHERGKVRGKWLLLVVDEAGRDAPSWDNEGPIVEMATQGQGLGIILHTLVQVPSLLSTTVLSLSARKVLFRSDAAVYRKLKGKYGVDVPADVRAHVAQQWHFAVFDGTTWEKFDPVPAE